MTKTALITGITGQDGAYLTELLLLKGYTVFGTHRHAVPVNVWRLQELGLTRHPGLRLLALDPTDLRASLAMVHAVRPDEIYNLAAQSFIGAGFDEPTASAQINGIGALTLLEAIRQGKPDTRFYQASTSEMFGNVAASPQDENTPFHPRNPYGVAKLFAHWMTVHYRENHGMFGACGIAYNHESPLRGHDFVTRKITHAAARIKLGHPDVLELGNLDAQRDWGDAKEYVEGMWRMLQASKPDTFVLATGRAETVRTFVERAFNSAAIDVEFRGAGLDEVAVDCATGQVVVRIHPRFYRPAEAQRLVGHAEKAERVLDWKPRASLGQICRGMVEADLRRCAQTDCPVMQRPPLQRGGGT